MSETVSSKEKSLPVLPSPKGKPSRLPAIRVGWAAGWKARAHRLKRETIALALAARHPGTPWYAKAWVGLVVAYAFSPIDLIPDFIPVLGQLDDLLLVPLGIALALRMIPGEVMAECRRQTDLITARPSSWGVAVLIVLLWLSLLTLAAWWAIRAFSG